jgi:hypothetical protein
MVWRHGSPAQRPRVAGRRVTLGCDSVLTAIGHGCGRTLRSTIEEYLQSHRVFALVKVESDEDAADGLISLVKSSGFGPLGCRV